MFATVNNIQLSVKKKLSLYTLMSKENNRLLIVFLVYFIN